MLEITREEVNELRLRAEQMREGFGQDFSKPSLKYPDVHEGMFVKVYKIGFGYAYRAMDLFDDALLLLDEKSYLSSAMVSRGFFETAVMLFYFSNGLGRKIAGGDIPGAEAVVDKHWATIKHKTGLEGYNATHVNDALEFLYEEERQALGNVIPMKPPGASRTDYEITREMGRTRWTYSILCELTHPNPYGSHMYYLRQDNEEEREQTDLWMQVVSLNALQYTFLVGNSLHGILLLHELPALNSKSSK